MKRFAAHILPLALSAVLLTPAHAAEPARRPNVVVILADDQGWGDLSIHGNKNLETPRIDSLGRDGALFEHFYVCPVCSPTRAEFLTGRWHPRGGVWSTSTGGERLDLDERTIAQAFQAAGYATGAFGKWHNGTQWPYHPNARGFAEYFGFTSGHWGQYFHPLLERNGQTVQPPGYITDVLTDEALKFIETHRGGPFFCYLPFNTPHSPMQVPDRFYEKFADAPLPMRFQDPSKEELPMTRAALAMVENIDWNVGRVLDKLDELKLAEDTIVLYFSDNGPNSFRWNGGLRGRKASTDEGGVRSPCLVRWPGQIPPGKRIKSIAGAVDLLPTLAELARVPVTDCKPLDGMSMSPWLRGTATDLPYRMIFSHWNGKVSVRSQRFRLSDDGKLYHIDADPGQLYNVSAQHPIATKRLTKAVESWSDELLKGLRDDQRPLTVGYREFPLTNLPARDAVSHGNIQRSARAPNCSFLRNWTSVDDKITWNVEVATPGRYEAIIYYTCVPENVGAVVELSLGAGRVEAKVNEAHDPPLVGAADDRVPRQGESYVKDFRPWSMGQLTLAQGRGTLTLRALSIPGKEAIDVRGVSLKLMD